MTALRVEPKLVGMKRLLLLLPLVALASCSGDIPKDDSSLPESGGNLSGSECMALDETRSKLLARSRQAANSAGQIENPTRMARNEPCFPLMDESVDA